MSKKTYHCPAGVWTKIIANFGTGFPRTFNINLINPSGDTVEGEYHEQRYFWIFPEVPVFGKLAPHLTFHRHWINAIYSVSVRPAVELTIEVQ